MVFEEGHFAQLSLQFHFHSQYSHMQGWSSTAVPWLSREERTRKASLASRRVFRWSWQSSCGGSSYMTCRSSNQAPTESRVMKCSIVCRQSDGGRRSCWSSPLRLQARYQHFGGPRN